MSVTKNASRMSVAVLLSRVLGLVREQVFAGLFGAGLYADAYQVAYRIPNLLRDMFAEGALSLSFMTVLTRCRDEGERRLVAERVGAVATLVFGLVGLGLLLAAPWLARLAAGSFAEVPGKLEITTGLTRLFSPFLYFSMMAALSMGLLNALGSYFTPALGPAAFNLGNIVIGGGLAWWLFQTHGEAAAIWGFGVGTLAGGVLQGAIQWPALWARGHSPFARLPWGRGAWREAFRDARVRSTAQLMLPAVLSLASVQITAYLGIWYASRLEPGSVSWINYAYRLLHFPMGVFGVALSQAAHPKLAELLRAGRPREFGQTLERALVLALQLAVGAAAGLIVFRGPIVSLLYQHGRFAAQDTAMTVRCLAAYAVGLAAFIAIKIFVQAYYVLHQTWLPTLASFAAIILSVGLNVGLSHKLGTAGVPLSTALSASFACLCMGWGLRRHLFTRESWRPLAAAGVGALFLGLLAFLELPEVLLRLRETQGFTSFAVATLLTVAVSGALYLAIALKGGGRSSSL